MTSTKSPLRIVLIEDNPDHVRILQWAFRRSGRQDQFMCFEDGHSALEYLSQATTGNDDGPDVILLDFNLPRIDGREVLRRLKETDQTKSIPVIVLSSSERDEDVRRAYELGASSYFSKSVILDDLHTVLRALQQDRIGKMTPPGK